MSTDRKLFDFEVFIAATCPIRTFTCCWVSPLVETAEEDEEVLVRVGKGEESPGRRSSLRKAKRPVEPNKKNGLGLGEEYN